MYAIMGIFLPTPSVRRATTPPPARPTALQAFLPTPSVRRATLRLSCPHFGRSISTHALREEGDRNCSSLRCALLISTHALREEGDVAGPSSGLTASNFYPRPP